MLLRLLCLSAFLSVPVLARAADLPASQETVDDRLNNSPRHAEVIQLEVPGREDGPVYAWVVYPERADAAPAVVVIHEIFALTEWVRGVADQLAAEGFIAIAPDLISGRGPGGGNSDSLANERFAVPLVMALDRAQIDGGVRAAMEYVKGLDSCSGEIGVVGYCWGGGQSFFSAAMQPDLGAAIVYYGISPPAEIYKSAKVPVLGLYGESDFRITAGVPAAEEAMAAAGNSFEVHVFEGAGHGFLRQQEGQDGANLNASIKGWARTIEFFREHLEAAE